MPRQFDDELDQPLVKDVSFSDENLLANDSFSRVSAKHKSDESVRFAVIPQTPLKQAHVHGLYADSIADPDFKGKYLCLSPRDERNNIVTPAVCCRNFRDDKSSAKLILGMIVVKYTTADLKTGKFERDAPAVLPFEIGYVTLSRSAFKTVANLCIEDHEMVWDFDIVMSGKGKESGYSYTRIARTPRYAADPSMKQAVLDAAAPFLDGKMLVRRLGKEISAEDFALIEPLRKGAVVYEGGE